MGDEVEVRREDQDKINKFSRLHQHELSIEEELTSKNVRRPSRQPPLPTTAHTPRAERKGGARRYHDRAGAGRRRRKRTVRFYRSPRTTLHPNPHPHTNTPPTDRYKIGDAFFHLPLPQAQELLGLSTARLEEEISELEDKLETIRDEMTQLKVDLYARFGKTINLET